MLDAGHRWDEMLYLDFEDSRLEGFAAEDFNLLLECHQEMYGKRPMLFLDEIQNIEGWQKFARNLADKKYSVFITGSNAKMLSKEIMAELGGRYLPVEVYPFSFAEKESVCKYYFIDNGILSLQLMDGETALLENLVALSLFRKYGHDLDNDRVYFYHANVEVDFYVPEDELAVQVAYSLADPETAEREVGAITKLSHFHPCRRRIRISFETSSFSTY